MSIYVPEQTNEITLEWLERQLYLISDTFSVSFNVWGQIRFPFGSIGPSGAASEPDFDGTKGGWLFSRISTETFNLGFQLPNDWKVGASLTPHFHWEKSVSDSPTPMDVYWQVEYSWRPVGGAMEAFVPIGSATVQTSTPDDGSADIHLLTKLSVISTEGRGLDDVLILKISRVPGNAADTYASDARLLEFDIEYLKDGVGSSGTDRK